MNKKLSIVLLLFLSLPLCVYAASDILTDYSNEDKDVEAEDILSPDLEKKAEALTAYAEFCLDLEKRKFDEETAEKLVKIIKNDPDASWPLSYLLTYWKRKNTIEKNIDRLIPTAEANPGAVHLNLKLAAILVKFKRQDKAISLLENSLKHSGDFAAKKRTEFVRLVDLLSALLEKEKKFSRGSELFSSLPDKIKDLNDLRLYGTAARYYYRGSKETTETQNWFMSWFSDSPKEKYEHEFKAKLDKITAFCESRFLVSEELSMVMDIFRATKQLKAAKEIILGNLLFEPDDLRSQVLLAIVCGELEEQDEALRVWRILAKGNGKEKPGLFKELGEAEFKCKNFKEAKDAFLRYLSKNPSDGRVVYKLGFCYYELKLYDDARREFSALGKSPYAFYMVALCYKKTKNYDSALKAIQKARQLAEEQKLESFLDKNLYFTLAMLAEKNKNLKLAEESLQEVLKKKTDDPEASNFLGYIWADNNVNLDEAERLIRIAVKAKPESSAFLDSLAWVLYRKDDFQGALKYIKKAVKNSDGPPDPVISDHAGDIYIAVGDVESAVKYWKQALASPSDDIDPERVKAKINKYSPSLEKTD